MGPFMEALQMNKHIELVKKWLADPESVSLEELADNKTAAWAAWDVGYDWDAAVEAAEANIYWEAKAVEAVVYWAAKAAYWAAEVATAVGAAMAIYWRNQAIKYVKQYEELTQ
jgi:hypothetical protein